MRIIWHNNNEAGITDWNRQRARSAPILAALKIVQEVSRKHNMQVFARHILGRRNTISDALSRSDKSTARKQAKEDFGRVEILNLGTKQYVWIARVIRSARESDAKQL